MTASSSDGFGRRLNPDAAEFVPRQFTNSRYRGRGQRNFRGNSQQYGRQWRVDQGYEREDDGEGRGERVDGKNDNLRGKRSFFRKFGEFEEIGWF